MPACSSSRISLLTNISTSVKAKGIAAPGPLPVTILPSCSTKLAVYSAPSK